MLYYSNLGLHEDISIANQTMKEKFVKSIDDGNYHVFTADLVLIDKTIPAWHFADGDKSSFVSALNDEAFSPERLKSLANEKGSEKVNKEMMVLKSDKTPYFIKFGNEGFYILKVLMILSSSMAIIFSKLLGYNAIDCYPILYSANGNFVYGWCVQGTDEKKFSNKLIAADTNQQEKVTFKVSKLKGVKKLDQKKLIRVNKVPFVVGQKDESYYLFKKN